MDAKSKFQQQKLSKETIYTGVSFKILPLRIILETKLKPVLFKSLNDTTTKQFPYISPMLGSMDI